MRCGLQRAHLPEFLEQVGQRGNIEVPFQQRGQHTDATVGLRQQLPHGVNHVRPVRIDLEILGLVEVPGDVNIARPLQRQGLQENQRIIAVVDAVHVDIVHVQQQITVALLQYGRDELGFTEIPVRLRIIGCILEGNGGADNILYLADALGHVMHGLLGERNGQEVIQMPLGCTVGEVLAVQRHVDLIHQRAH